ncbi:unnamed protein product [Heterosigma akashiwo]
MGGWPCVRCVVHTHFQYLYSSQRFFVMDAEDELCLSLNKGAGVHECKVFDGGPTAPVLGRRRRRPCPLRGGAKCKGLSKCCWSQKELTKESA